MNDITKSRLVDALLEAEGVELENTKCVSMPSSAFSHRIQRIVENPEKYTKKCRAKKIVIILIAAALILTGCTAIKPIRTAIADFIITIFDNGSFVDKSTDKNETTEITELYSPKYIPVGYELYNESIDTSKTGKIKNYILEYKNADSEIHFIQFTANSSMTINTENTEPEIIKAGEIECMCYTNMDRRDFIWEQNGYRFTLSTPDNLLEETVIKIIESVRISEFTNN